MPKLTAYCEAILEATWLTAVICVPLFLNIWGESIQTQKNYLLRSLGMVVLTAWAIRWICRAGQRGDRADVERASVNLILRTPFAGLIIALALVWIVSTLLSVSPWVSFWGHWFRRDGAFTYLTCLVFFGALAMHLRSMQQVHRLLTAAIATSLPISLYAVGQRFSIEPVITDAGLDRVTSTFANPVFLGAYLIMTLPLALSRVIQSAMAFSTDTAHRALHAIQAAAYGSIAALQLCAILFTASRGPFLGLVTALGTMALLLAIRLRQRWLVGATLVIGLLLLTGVALLSWPEGPLRRWAEHPTLGRLSQILNPRVGSGAERKALWQVAANAARFSKNLEGADGRKDSLSGLRFLVGHGPETAGALIRAHGTREYNEAFFGHEPNDRFHNDVWDVWVTTGSIGLAVYLTLTLLAVYYGCKWLNLVATARHKKIFWSLFVGTGLVAALGLAEWLGAGFVWAGFRLGSWLGLIAYWLWHTWSNQGAGFNPTEFGSRGFVLVALLSAVIAHLTEISFSFDLETTTLYFFAYLAVMLAIGHRFPALAASQAAVEPTAAENRFVSHPKAEPIKAKSTRGIGSRKAVKPKISPTDSWPREIFGALALALILGNIGAILIQGNHAGFVARSVFDVFKDALMFLPGKNNAQSWLLAIATTALWPLLGVLLTNEVCLREGSTSAWRRTFARTMALSGGMALIYWITLAEHTVTMAGLTRFGLDEIGRFLGEYLFFVNFYYGFTFAAILLMAVFLAKSRPVIPEPAHRGGRVALVAAVLAGGTLALIWTTNLAWAKGGVLLRRANYFAARQQWPVAAAICRIAIQAVPAADDYYLALASCLEKEAAATPDMGRRRALHQAADGVLETGTRLRSLDPSFLIARGNLHLKWAQDETDIELRRSLGQQAIDQFRQASVLDPGNFHVWDAMAYLEMALFHSLDAAQGHLLRSLDLYPAAHKTHGFLGDLYFQKGMVATNGTDRRQFLRKAVDHYQQASQIAGAGDGETAYLYATALAKSHVELRELTEAAAAYRSALGLAPTAERWRTEEALARLYAELKDPARSSEHMRRAVELAPPGKHPNFDGAKTGNASPP